MVLFFLYMSLRFGLKVVFSKVVSRVMISFRITLILPISAVTENMKRAQRRNAIMEQKLLFRKGIATCNSPPCARGAGCTLDSDDVVEMTVNEIINGWHLEISVRLT